MATATAEAGTSSIETSATPARNWWWSAASDQAQDLGDLVLPDMPLYIGGVETRDVSWLNEKKITHIVDASNFSFPRKEETVAGRKVLTVDVDDSPTVKIDKYFGAVNKFIDEALDDNGVVLVHCMAGVSRSAALVLGFLIWKKNWTLKSALQTVEKARPTINPNQAFRRQLLDYEKKVLELKGLNAPIPE